MSVLSKTQVKKPPKIKVNHKTMEKNLYNLESKI